MAPGCLLFSLCTVVSNFMLALRVTYVIGSNDRDINVCISSKTCLPFVLRLCNSDYSSYENICIFDIDVALRYASIYKGY